MLLLPLLLLCSFSFSFTVDELSDTDGANYLQLLPRVLEQRYYYYNFYLMPFNRPAAVFILPTRGPRDEINGMGSPDIPLNPLSLLLAHRTHSRGPYPQCHRGFPYAVPLLLHHHHQHRLPHKVQQHKDTERDRLICRRNTQEGEPILKSVYPIPRRSIRRRRRSTGIEEGCVGDRWFVGWLVDWLALLWIDVGRRHWQSSLQCRHISQPNPIQFALAASPLVCLFLSGLLLLFQPPT